MEIHYAPHECNKRRRLPNTSAVTDFHAKVRTGAWLFRYGWIDLQTVIDKLQGYAVRCGIVRELGQDEVQRILSAAFADIERELAE